MHTRVLSSPFSFVLPGSLILIQISRAEDIQQQKEHLAPTLTKTKRMQGEERLGNLMTLFSQCSTVQH